MQHPNQDKILEKDIDLWQKCIDFISQDLPHAQFDAWIKPLKVEWIESNKLLIYASNRFKLDWLRSQYSGLISQTLNQVCGKDIVIEFTIQKKKLDDRASEHRDNIRSESNMSGINLNLPIKTKMVSKDEHVSNLNADYRFDNLVEGTANPS